MLHMFLIFSETKSTLQLHPMLKEGCCMGIIFLFVITELVHSSLREAKRKKSSFDLGRFWGLSQALFPLPFFVKGLSPGAKKVVLGPYQIVFQVSILFVVLHLNLQTSMTLNSSNIRSQRMVRILRCSHTNLQQLQEALDTWKKTNIKKHSAWPKMAKPFHLTYAPSWEVQQIWAKPLAYFAKALYREEDPLGEFMAFATISPVLVAQLPQEITFVWKADKSKNYPRFGLGVAFLTTRQLTWAFGWPILKNRRRTSSNDVMQLKLTSAQLVFSGLQTLRCSLFGFLIVDLACSLLKKIINQRESQAIYGNPFETHAGW